MIVLNTAYALWRKPIGGEQFFKFFEISYLLETSTVFQFFPYSPTLSVSAHRVLGPESTESTAESTALGVTAESTESTESTASTD